MLLQLSPRLGQSFANQLKNKELHQKNPFYLLLKSQPLLHPVDQLRGLCSKKLLPSLFYCQSPSRCQSLSLSEGLSPDRCRARSRWRLGRSSKTSLPKMKDRWSSGMRSETKTLERLEICSSKTETCTIRCGRQKLRPPIFRTGSASLRTGRTSRC